uniref:NYN domain-containing protein n=1 Tax=Arundo donax TaxID=35708 RepID=A0A0A9DGG1_ARUDO
MLVDMLFWAFDNPPPGNYLIISGDPDLSDLLHRLGMKRYDILLVRPANASSQPLAAAAKRVWLWESLAAGEGLLPEAPATSSVLGCKLNEDNSDTLKRSHSKVHSKYGKGGGMLKTCNDEYRVKPLQKYVKKTNGASSSAGIQDRVESVGVLSSTESTVSEPYQSSVSSSSSSTDSDSPEKVDTSIPLETPTLSKLSTQKPVLSTQSQQVAAKHESILGERPSTSAQCVARNGTLNFGGSSRHYNQIYKQKGYIEAQNVLHSEFRVCDNNEKAVNRRREKPLQKYVKKTSITFCSARNQADSVRVPDCPIGSTKSELDQSAVSSASGSETLVVTKVGNLAQPETSTLSHSSAQKSVAPAHLHHLRAPHESILGKKASISVEHTSRNGAHDFDVSTVHYHPANEQSQSSEAQNKLRSCSNMDDNSRKLGNEQKHNQRQVYVKKIYISSASASNEIEPVNGFLDNPKGSTLSHPS